MRIQDDNDLLKLLITDMEDQSVVAKPTSYWLEYCSRILDETSRTGLSRFRSNWRLVKGYGYFPILEPIGADSIDPSQPVDHRSDVSGNRHERSGLLELWKRNERQYDSVVAAHMSLLYGWLSTGEVSGELLRSVTESKLGDPKLYRVDGRSFSPNFLRRLNVAALCLLVLKDFRMKRVMEIGGGYGVFPEILLSRDASLDGYFVAIDIPPVLYIQTQYLKALFPGRVMDYREIRERARVTEAEARGKIVVAPPWSLPKLDLEFDCLYNSASFQEMEQDVVANYLDLLLPRCRTAFITSLVDGHKPGARGQKAPITFEWICKQFDLRGFQQLARSEGTPEAFCFAADMPKYDYAAFRCLESFENLQSP